MIDILRHYRQSARMVALQTCKRVVGCIRRHGPKHRPALIIERLHQLRIARERLGRGHVFDIVLCPDATRIAKGRNTAFGR